MEKFYTPQEVAKILNISTLTVYRWIKSGKLKAAKVGKWYISEKDFNQTLEASKK